MIARRGTGFPSYSSRTIAAARTQDSPIPKSSAVNVSFSVAPGRGAAFCLFAAVFIQCPTSFTVSLVRGVSLTHVGHGS